MITVALIGAAERAQRFAAVEARLPQRFAEVMASFERPRRIAKSGVRAQLVRARQRFRRADAIVPTDEIAALDAAVMEELEA